ncbi:hypothetical protein VZT92_010947 [Zoarces viviparus]|uniref:Uncharacterized protein n=1 Tax=Zoarces viviparus TaxID=48416 RepID=A0AAW1FBE3_ZOAVI
MGCRVELLLPAAPAALIPDHSIYGIVECQYAPPPPYMALTAAYPPLKLTVPPYHPDLVKAKFLKLQEMMP